MSYWAIDLGTTNSTIARWNDLSCSPELLHMEEVCREPIDGQEIEVRYSIPSCLYILPQKDWKTRIGAWPFFQKHFFIGSQALIGRQAIEKDACAYSPAFIPGFKPYLIRDSYRTLSRIGNKSYSARKTATTFVRELLFLIKKKTGERPRYVTFSVPVDSYEPYRAELKHIAYKLGIKHFNPIDEPVAAAIGYGLRIDEPQCVLVIDFGGGTLDLALIEILEKQAELGRARVIAKYGAPVGGNVVDAWLVSEFCKILAYDLQKHSTDPNVKWWYRIMLEEACRVKESLFFQPQDTFFITPPRELQSFEALLYAKDQRLDTPLDVTREELVTLLEKRELYSLFDRCIDSVLEQAEAKGVTEQDISEVLMVGGSTLLPNIYSRVEELFGRDKMRAWQPFAAVAYGACAFSAGHLTKSDFITHDYAFITYDKDTHEPQYNIIIPRGTPFPTIKNFWKRQLTPTCPLGEPERIFKLLICEIGKAHSVEQEFVWDSFGRLHSFKAGDEKKPLVIPLNESNPTLGYLNPPHPPSDRSARLEVAFMVNKERWLCTTVYDIKTHRYLLVDAPVYKLK
jgi:molecular chaperone DnaK